MSWALFRSNMRAQWFTMTSYGISMILYLWLLIWVFPSITASPAMNQLLATLPQSMLKVFGVSAGMQQLADFLAGEFYSLIYILLFAVYVISAATKLVSHLVDRGSMAYLLATPVSRARIAITHAVVLLVGIVIISVLTTAGGLLGAHWITPQIHINIRNFILLNVVGLLIFAVIAGYSYLFSALFNEEKRALAVASALTLIFYILGTAGKMSDHIAWMKNFSLFTVYDAQAILHGDAHVVAICLSLVAAALLLFAMAVLIFRRRQLPL